MLVPRISRGKHRTRNPGETTPNVAYNRASKEQGTNLNESANTKYYGDQPLNKYFRADFVCYDSIIVELKATNYTVEANKSQTLNNIKAAKYKLGLLVNFGMPSLKYYRLVN